MCGRFTLIAKQEVLEKRFHAEFEEPLIPRYNAAPGQNMPVILNTNPKVIRLLNWGIAPAWLAKFGGRKELINIRAETLKEKKTFAGDLAKRRCLVLADSFYEWKAVPGQKRKVPYRILMKNEKPFAFAGLWEEGKNELARFAIVTTAPNELVAKIHNRMPVILSPRDEQSWLDTSRPVGAALQALRSFPAKEMTAYRISTVVNRATVDSPSVIAPSGNAEAKRKDRVGERAA